MSIPTPLAAPEPAREALPENTTEMQLSLLKEDIRDHVRRNMDSVLQYCQKNKFNFSDWKNFDPARHLDQVKAVYNLLFGDPDVPPGGNTPLNTRLQGLEKNPPDPDVLTELTNLVTLLETLNELRQETRERHEDLSSDIEGGAVKKVAEHVKGLFREHPLMTILASGMALWAGSVLWKESKKFRWAAIGTAGALSLNHLLGPIFGGRDAIDAILNKPDSDFEELLAGAEEKLEREVDKRAFRAMIHMGQVPFSVFLTAYQRALEDGNLEINMRRLQQAARRNRFGRQIPRHYFDQSNGKGMFAEMERLVGGKTDGRIAHMKQKYVDNGLNMSLFKVMVAEYDTVPEDMSATGAAVATGALATTVSGTIPATTNTPTATAPESKIDQALTDELKGVTDFEALDVKVFEIDPTTGKGKASIMGFTLDFVRTEKVAVAPDPNATPPVAAEPASLTYRFVVDPSKASPLTLQLNLKDTPADQAIQIDDIKTALEARMMGLVGTLLPAPPGAPTPLVSPSWNSAIKEWETKGFSPNWPSLTHLLSSPGLPIAGSSFDFTYKLDESNSIQMYYGDKQFSSLRDLHEIAKEEKIEELLKAQSGSEDTANLFRGLDVEVTDATNWTRILVNVEGAVFTLLYLPNPSRFLISRYEASDRFVQAKSRAIQERSDFKGLFDKLYASGEKLSDVGRGALDILSGNWGSIDSKNAYWLELVDLKRFELLHDYEEALKAVGASGSITPAPALGDTANTLNRTEKTLLDKIRDLGLYPDRLATASANGDQRTYESLENEFRNFEYSRTYSDRTEAFYTAINAINFAGINEKSNSAHQRIIFNVMRIWYERTGSLKEADSFNQTQLDFLNDLQEKILGILNRGVLHDEGFLQGIRQGISFEEFKTALPGLNDLVDYPTWQIEHGRSEGLEQQIPLLGHMHLDVTVIPPAGRGSKHFQIQFSNGVVWSALINSATGGLDLDYSTLQMTPDMIRAQAASLEHDPAFVQPFDRLKNIWANMNDRNWDHPFEGQVEEGRWASLVEYKRQEALTDYQRDLEEALRMPSGPEREAAWGAIHDNLGARYFGSIDLLGTTMEARINSKIHATPPQKLTRYDFDNFYNDLQDAGYESNGYALEIRQLREDAQFFDYVGWRGMDSRTEHDILNKVVALQHRYMRAKMSEEGSYPGFSRHFRRLDISEWNRTITVGSAQIQSPHRKYFEYVKGEIMNHLRAAFQNNANGAGTWLDHAIGAEELPTELNVVSFEEFLKRPDLLTRPNFSYSPQQAQHPVETQEQQAARVERFRGQLDHILEERFLDPVSENNTAEKEGWEVGNVNQDDANGAEIELRRMLDKEVDYVRDNPGSEDQRADAFRDSVRAKYRALQGWRYWPWNWGQ